MGFERICSVIYLYAILLVIFSSPAKVIAGDIVHDDDSAPKKPGCNNVFILVLYPTLHFFTYPFRFFLLPLLGFLYFLVLILSKYRLWS